MRSRLGVALTATVAVVLVASVAGAAQVPVAELQSEQEVSPLYAQGIARSGKGWILSGRNVLGRFDKKLKERKQVRNVIPKEWLAKGFNHVGDIDVVGGCVYAPLEQSNYERGDQATARYDVKTLKFVDAVSLTQHENSFVTIDPATMTAYSMDRFDGDALLRYDVRRDWAPLPPLQMDMLLMHTQGADFLGDAIWISTSDPQNNLYRVDADTGHVDGLGSAGHVPGEGEGIDVTPLKSGLLHTLVVDPKLNPVWLGHFAASASDIAGQGPFPKRCRPTS